MGENIQSSPTIVVSGMIKSVSEFEDCYSLYVKYEVVMGEQWKVLSGKCNGESFESIIDNQIEVVIEQPIQLQLMAKQVRGWPKVIVEVWQVDIHGRHNIAGYTQFNIPYMPTVHVLQAPCWRPKPTFSQRITANYPELMYRDVIVSSNNRNGFQTETTGIVTVQLEIIAKDFQYHGVNLGTQH